VIRVEIFRTKPSARRNPLEPSWSNLASGPLRLKASGVWLKAAAITDRYRRAASNQIDTRDVQARRRIDGNGKTTMMWLERIAA